MTRRIHQVQGIFLPILGGVFQPNSLGFNGNTAFTFDIHRVENLFGHFTLGQATGQLDQTIGQGRFTMVDMGNDRKVTNVLKVSHFGCFWH